MDDRKATADEARRASQHASMASRVAGGVNADIVQRADVITAGESERMDAVVGRMRGAAIDTVVDTDREVQRSRSLARGSQVVDYVFYVLYTLLAIRLALALIGARPASGFVQLIHAATSPFYAMFRGIVASPTADGAYTLALPIVIALAAYAILHAGIKSLLRLIANRQTAI